MAVPTIATVHKPVEIIFMKNASSYGNAATIKYLGKNRHHGDGFYRCKSARLKAFFWVEQMIFGKSGNFDYTCYACVIL